MILPERIGNGQTHDDDDTDDDVTRGVSLYLEEAVDVSYSGDGIELPMNDFPGLFVVNPDDGNRSMKSSDENDTPPSQYNLHRTLSHHPRGNIDLPLLLRSSKSTSNWKRLNDDETKSKSTYSRTDTSQPADNTSSRSSPDTTIESESDSDQAISSVVKHYQKKAGYTKKRKSKPYKIDQIQRNQFYTSTMKEGRETIINTLKDMGIKVYVLDGRVIPDSYALLLNVKKVVTLVARENYSFSSSRCLLFQDEYGRLFNVVLSKHTLGYVQRYQEDQNTYSGLQAMIALTILCRSIPCLLSGADIQNFYPLALSVVLGLVFTQEISLSWLNASLMVRSLPSVSAHTLVSPDAGADYVKMWIIFSLALVEAAQGSLRTALACSGIAAACIVLLANLGSRAWYFLRWKPLQYQGFGSTAIAYFLAVCIGVILPYMGHRNITVGGKGAMEYVIRNGLILALVFALSDIDSIQQFLVAGSERCNQNIVNIVIGAWWFTTFFVSLFIAHRIPYYDQLLGMKASSVYSSFAKQQNRPLSYYYDGEKVLEDDHTSPVGYKVPTLPDFEFDPSLVTNTGMNCFTVNNELIFGVLLSVVIGGCLLYLAISRWDDNL